MAAAAYLLLMGVEPTSHTDTARDILLARDGLASGIYYGCASSFDTFRQGALWVRSIALALALGLGPVALHLAIATWLTLGVALFDQLGRTHFGDKLGWEATAIFLSTIVMAVGYPNLWNPTIASLAVVLLTWSLLGVVTRGSIGAACASGVSLALTAEASWSAFLVMPLVTVCVLASSQRPMAALIVCTMSVVLPSIAWSRTTWQTNLEAMGHQPWYVPFIAILTLATLAVGLAFRSHWLGIAIEARRRWILALLVSTVAGLAVVASLIAGRLLVSPQYLFTALPAAAILSTLALRARSTPGTAGWRRRVPAVVALIALAMPLLAAGVWRFGISGRSASIPGYSMRESRIIADHLYGAGHSFSYIQRHLRGPDSIDLLHSIAAFAPAPGATRTRHRESLRILAFHQSNRPTATLPADGEEVDLGRGRRAWILPIKGWVRLAPSRVCYSTAGTEACVEIDRPEVPLGDRFRDLAFPRYPAIHDAYMAATRDSHGGPVKVTWELPIVLRGDDTERHVQLASIIAPPWRIERVEDFRFRGELPARSVVLERGRSIGGRLVISSDTVPHREYPPAIVETAPAEDDLRETLATLPPLGRYVCGFLDTCP